MFQTVNPMEIYLQPLAKGSALVTSSLRQDLLRASQWSKERLSTEKLLSGNTEKTVHELRTGPAKQPFFESSGFDDYSL